MILTAKNPDVDDLNEKTLKRLMSEEKTYYSADSAFDDDGNRDDSVSHEYLNSIVISGMPIHCTLSRSVLLFCCYVTSTNLKDCVMEPG